MVPCTALCLWSDNSIRLRHKDTEGHQGADQVDQAGRDEGQDRVGLADLVLAPVRGHMVLPDEMT